MTHETDYSGKRPAEMRPADRVDRDLPFVRFIRSTSRWLLRSEWMRDLVSFHTSLVFHCVLLLVLALLILDPPAGPEGRTLLVGAQRVAEENIEFLDVVVDSPQTLEDALVSPAVVEVEVELPDAFDLPLRSQDKNPGGLTSKPSLEAEDIPANDLLMVSEAPVGGGFEGRSPAERARLVREHGGSAESENAVERGLAWLAAHQRQDGSWLLDHHKGPCDGSCRNPGQKVETAIGATGLALLPFLGAGYTHLQGEYQKVVSRGFEFLQTQMKITNHGGDLSWDSTVGMYAHGIATLAFCEAFAMTGDQALQPFAQPAVNYIRTAQGPRGGWRYMRGEPGDTTVTGWQVMCLKSARLGHLFVPRDTTENAKAFLNTVQDGGGAFYGYMTPVKDPGPTAVGLLLRMYLGWSRQDARLQRGVNYLAHLGPSKSDMYFNYYATQVLHHRGGNHWPKWNREMRDYLVGSQATTGHERGSWFFVDPHGSVGGRHYTTAICTMILEVYYRHMPLYGELAVEDAL